MSVYAKTVHPRVMHQVVNHSTSDVQCHFGVQRASRQRNSLPDISLHNLCSTGLDEEKATAPCELPLLIPLYSQTQPREKEPETEVEHLGDDREKHEHSATGSSRICHNCDGKHTGTVERLDKGSIDKSCGDNGGIIENPTVTDPSEQLNKSRCRRDGSTSRQSANDAGSSRGECSHGGVHYRSSSNGAGPAGTAVGGRSADVRVRLARRRRRRHHHRTTSCSHERQTYENDRHAVLFMERKRPTEEGTATTHTTEGPNSSDMLQRRFIEAFHGVAQDQRAGPQDDAQNQGNMARAPMDEEELNELHRDTMRFLDEAGVLMLQEHQHFLDLFGGPDPLQRLEDQANAPTYPRGTAKYAECQICYLWTELSLRPCCGFPVCTPCLTTYFETQVSMANVKMQCLGDECTKSVHRDEILAMLDIPFRNKFNQFLVDANRDPHSKTCPRCSHVMTLDLQLLNNPQARKFGFRVDCTACNLAWCFPCQSPWHEPIKCKVYQRGDKLLKTWAREQHYGQANAQKCPKCKVYIQRSSGCDHMTCSRCKTNFCYRCGEQFRELKFVGNHYSKLSIFGCKYRFMPNNPIQRKLIRGSIFGGKLLAAPVVGGLALGAGAVVIGIGALVLPIYGAYKLHKKLQQRKRAKRQRRAREEMFKKLEEMHKRGEELDISNPISNTDIIAEIEASQIGAESFARRSPSFFSSASDSDSLYVVHVEPSLADSDSSSLNFDLMLQDKSCQTSQGHGFVEDGGVSGAAGNSHHCGGRTGFCRRYRDSFDSRSLPPDMDLRYRPPSPAYFMFTRPTFTEPAGVSCSASPKEKSSEEYIHAEEVLVSRVPPEASEVQEIAELFYVDLNSDTEDDEDDFDGHVMRKHESCFSDNVNSPVEPCSLECSSKASCNMQTIAAGCECAELMTRNNANQDNNSATVVKGIEGIGLVETRVCDDSKLTESQPAVIAGQTMCSSHCKEETCRRLKSQSEQNMAKTSSKISSSLTAVDVDHSAKVPSGCNSSRQTSVHIVGCGSAVLANEQDSEVRFKAMNKLPSSISDADVYCSDKRGKFVLPCDFVIRL